MTESEQRALEMRATEATEALAMAGAHFAEALKGLGPAIQQVADALSRHAAAVDRLAAAAKHQRELDALEIDF